MFVLQYELKFSRPFSDLRKSHDKNQENVRMVDGLSEVADGCDTRALSRFWLEEARVY